MRRGAIAEIPSGAAPIPNTPVLDDFNRANENPLSDGGKWSTRGTGVNLQVVSNAATGGNNTGLSSDYWNPSTFAANQEAYFTINAIAATGGFYVRLWLRLANPGASTEHGYMMQWPNNAPPSIFKETARETYTNLGTAGSGSYSVGDQIDFRASGTSLTVYQNGTSVHSVTDATFSNSGNIAFGCKGNTWALDDFGGGAY